MLGLGLKVMKLAGLRYHDIQITRMRSCLVVITHADRIKTSRTNAEQNKSCDVGREKRKGEGLKDKELIQRRGRERDERDCVLR
ncbi:hypothetical protein KUCAC02_004528 [Chaenocephalus aceratus]|uniref:Uncharacterized protein n=1 Tax=Chaenocephalus aceratus TaxID=36190 RepID=A0ACB9WYV2_CHAAC|nr:hypothetical protein KUCAC02_004528 [Chaenocephalus aceratus]